LKRALSWIIANNFSEADAQAIKDIEKNHHHDVKTVEYFLLKING